MAFIFVWSEAKTGGFFLQGCLENMEQATVFGIRLTQMPCMCTHVAGFGIGAFPPLCRLWGLLKKAESLRFEALEAHGGRSVGTLVTVLQRIMTDGGGLAGKSNRSAV